METAGKFINQKHTALINHMKESRKHPQKVLISKRLFGERNQGLHAFSLEENILLGLFASQGRYSSRPLICVFDDLLKIKFLEEIIDYLNREDLNKIKLIPNPYNLFRNKLCYAQKHLYKRNSAGTPSNP